MPLGVHRRYSAHAAPLGHERRWKSGWCEQAHPGRLAQWCGHGWYLVAREQSPRRLRVRAASCEAICSERVDRRGAKFNSEMYYNISRLSPWRLRNSLALPEACCNYYQWKVAIFATVFLVSLILCFGRDGSLGFQSWVFPYYVVLAVYVIQPYSLLFNK